MLLAARKTENTHVVLRNPLDAFKIQNNRTFTHAEIVDVNAAAHLLRDDMLGWGPSAFGGVWWPGLPGA